MQDFDISTAGVAKLLSNLNATKAAGPDAIRPIVLKELSQVVAPVITVIFQTSLDSGAVPTDIGRRPKSVLSSKNVITDRYLSLVSYAKLWSIL